MNNTDKLAQKMMLFSVINRFENLVMQQSIVMSTIEFSKIEVEIKDAINLLQGNLGYTVKQLSAELHLSETTLKIFKGVGKQKSRITLNSLETFINNYKRLVNDIHVENQPAFINTNFIFEDNFERFFK